MKTIGILGGLGPQATTDLEARIHRVSQTLIPPHQNTGYPPVVVLYYRHLPVLVKEDQTPVLPLQPDPRLLEFAKRLGQLCDFMLLPSNGIHTFQKEIEAAAGKKLLSMVDLTLDEVKRRNWKKVGVMTFRSTGIYTDKLKAMNIAVETLDASMCGKLDESIIRVMEGRDGAEDRGVALAAIEEFRSRKVDGIIPGCTEIPFLLGDEMKAAVIVNPLQLLAEAAVRFAIG